MRRASELLLLVAVLLGSACARGARLPARDQSAIAQAFTWMVSAAPPAKRYTFEINDGLITKAIAREIEGSSGMVRRGPEFRAKNVDEAAVGLVSIRADPPAWASLDEATVRISYQLEGEKRIHCTVRLRAQSEGNQQSLNGQPAGWTSWAIKASIASDCRARSAAPPPPS
jgi:hypothetical protein